MLQVLLKSMKAVILREKEAGKGRLADAIGCGIRTIERYLDESCPIPQANAYNLAKACGLSELQSCQIADAALRSKARARRSA